MPQLRRILRVLEQFDVVISPLYCSEKLREGLDSPEMMYLPPVVDALAFAPEYHMSRRQDDQLRRLNKLKPGSGRPSHATNAIAPGPHSFQCNRYEDGDFIEQQYVGGDNLTYMNTGCPSYP